MSAFGKRWMIDGVPAGPINRHYPSNGQYTVIFEREYASLEQIAALEATVSDQKTQLSEKDATIQTMKEAGTAADLGAELDAAYKEGVNSVE